MMDCALWMSITCKCSVDKYIIKGGASSQAKSAAAHSACICTANVAMMSWLLWHHYDNITMTPSCPSYSHIYGCLISLSTNVQYCIKVNGPLSQWFHIDVGLKQIVSYHSSDL